MRQAGVDPIILDAGDLFFTTPSLADSNRSSELYRASTMIKGYEQIGCDAINIGRYELSAGLPFLLKTQSSSALPFISANIIDKKTDELLFDSHIIIKRGILSVGVIGLIILEQTSELDVNIDNYISAGKTTIEKIREKVDLIVLLINAPKENQNSLTKDFPLADVIYTSGHDLLTRPMMKQPDESPYIYSTGREARYLNMTEIKINTHQDAIVNMSYLEERKKYNQRKLERLQDVDPTKPLEELYKDQKNVLNLIAESKNEIESATHQINQAVNTLSMNLIPLDANVKDDSNLLQFVNEALDICNQLKKLNQR